MNKRPFFVFLSALVLFCASFGVRAARDYYINDGSPLGMHISSAYAVGGDGITVQLGGGKLYALSASGLQSLEGDDLSGGGGLRYLNGSVTLDSDRIRVGLNYYYSEKRDGSKESANLENAVGSGYLFGMLDAKRRFVAFVDEEGESVGTSARRITMMPDGQGGVDVYNTESWELIYHMDSSGPNRALAVHPLAGDGQETLTWFNNRRYYGDFLYADLGNGKLTVSNVLELERYVLGVCLGEIGTSFHIEAMKAQAVCARTYAMYQIRNGNVYMSKCGFDLTNDEYCQAYLGYTDNHNLNAAVSATDHMYLTYNGAVINALYSAANGGESRNSEDVGFSYLPYLRGVVDPYEGAVWTRGVNGHQLGLSQWGAQAMAKHFDKTYLDILGFYYTDVGLSYGTYPENT